MRHPQAICSLHAGEDVFEFIQPCFLVLVDDLLVVRDDVDLGFLEETGGRGNVIAYAAAVELLRDQRLGFLARDEVDEFLGVFHVFGMLDDVDAVRLGDDCSDSANEIKARMDELLETVKAIDKYRNTN